MSVPQTNRSNVSVYFLQVQHYDSFQFYRRFKDEFQNLRPHSTGCSATETDPVTAVSYSADFRKLVSALLSSYSRPSQGRKNWALLSGAISSVKLMDWASAEDCLLMPNERVPCHKAGGFSGILTDLIGAFPAQSLHFVWCRKYFTSAFHRHHLFISFIYYTLWWDGLIVLLFQLTDLPWTVQPPFISHCDIISMWRASLLDERYRR